MHTHLIIKDKGEKFNKIKWLLIQFGSSKYNKIDSKDS